MYLNKDWSLYYVEDGKYSGNVLDYPTFSCFKHIKIPTLFELEIYKHGLLGHPYFSTNIWQYQKYETYHQFYVCKFKSKNRNKYLLLEGIDTISEIYINGELVGKTDNMFVPYRFHLTNLKEQNEIIIHILPAVLEGKKYDNHKWFAATYNYESLYIRKCPSSFGWDILPRTTLGGIYKNVKLENSLPVIDDIHIVASEVSKESAHLKFNISLNNIENFEYTIKGKCQESEFYLINQNEIVLVNPKLWTVRGYGEQNLYDIEITISNNGKIIAKKSLRFGIRKVELFKSAKVEKDGQFAFYINDSKVFLLGSNYVPIEAIKHLDTKRMNKALDMLVDLGCNSIRVWGGGTYECDAFYQRCDELGIFVWQDFMMGCAVYPQDELFANKLKLEIEYQVKRLRNYCSICLWAGDNENDLAGLYWSRGLLKPHDNILTRKVIPEKLEDLDHYRPYLPSSPYIDESLEEEKYFDLSEDHLWGPRDYFKGNYYKNAKAYFTSETGYHALNNYRSLKKFIKKPWPLFNKNISFKKDKRELEESNKPTKEYLCHATSVMDDYSSPYEYRIRLMYNQVLTLFKDDIDNVNDFILASQISQGEALKYFIEKMRRDYQRNGGIIWWNIIDGWPQVSDAIVDYYFSKKKAYNYIKISQKPTLLMMNEDEDALNLYCVSSENIDHKITYQIIDAYQDKIIDEGEIISKHRNSFIVKNIIANNKTLLIIKYVDESGNECINHFHTNIIDINFKKYVRSMKKYGLLK